MPKMKRYTDEFKDQAVRHVFESMGPDESRKEACRRVAPLLGVKEVTLYNWVKERTPSVPPKVSEGSSEALREEIKSLRKQVRELERANDILKAASAFFGAELDRQSKR